MTCSSEKKFELPWLILRTFVTLLLPLCSDSRRLLFRGLPSPPPLSPLGSPLSSPPNSPLDAQEEVEKRNEKEGGGKEEQEQGAGEENGVEDKGMDAREMVVKVFFSSAYSIECGRARNEIPEEWGPVIDAFHEMQDSKQGALVVG